MGPLYSTLTDLGMTPKDFGLLKVLFIYDMGNNSTSNFYHHNRPITAAQRLRRKKCKVGSLIDAQIALAHKLMTVIMSTPLSIQINCYVTDSATNCHVYLSCTTKIKLVALKWLDNIH